MSLNLDFISTEFNLKVVSNSESKAYLFEGYGLDVQRRMLYRGEHEVALPLKAIETLIALIELRGEFVSKDDLMKIIWADTIVEESNLDHYLHVLRKALGRKSDGQSFIETLRRRGYRFTPDVQVIEAPHRNGTRVAAADPNLTHLTDRQESLTGSPHLAADVPSVKALNTSRFSPLLGAIAVLAGLLGSAGFWYFQRQDLPKRAASLSVRSEISITPLTNPIAVSDASISPDGKYLVYYGFNHLYRIDTDGRNLFQLTFGERDASTSTISPDSNWVYYVSGMPDGDHSKIYLRKTSIDGSETVNVKLYVARGYQMQDAVIIKNF